MVSPALKASIVMLGKPFTAPQFIAPSLPTSPLPDLWHWTGGRTKENDHRSGQILSHQACYNETAKWTEMLR